MTTPVRRYLGKFVRTAKTGQPLVNDLGFLFRGRFDLLWTHAPGEDREHVGRRRLSRLPIATIMLFRVAESGISMTSSFDSVSLVFARTYRIALLARSMLRYCNLATSAMFIPDA